jgi:uncharacterized protein (DUF2252 family)
MGAGPAPASTEAQGTPLTVDERAELGKAARERAARSAHAIFEPASDRVDPVELLESQAVSRLSDLVSVRYGRMLASPLAFFRGAALVMASDLADSPSSGFQVQLCGDAHLSNFGLYASPERSLVFDINDFDETLPGPWEWDVKRLVASFAVAGRENGFASRERKRVILEVLREYREHMGKLAAMRELDVWYSHMLADEAESQAHLDPKLDRRVRRDLTKARSRDHLQAQAKLTRVVDGRRRLVSDPPLLVPIGELVGATQARKHERQMNSLIMGYLRSVDDSLRPLLERLRYVEMARKVVGVGSVGTRAWIVLLLGRDDDDPVFMQVKEAEPSVLERYLGPSEYRNAGQRVVAGQRRMQAESDILLGWVRAAGPDGYKTDYYVRQLRDWKGSAPVEAMSPEAMAMYGRICGQTLARAHARTGDRVAIAAYLGKSDSFDQASTRFAEGYADQNQRDYDALHAAVRTGRITAAPDL